MAEPAPHFIGWLPMPRAFAQFLLPVAIGGVVGLAVVAAVVAGGQRSPGNGRWEDDRTVTLVGIAYAEPYAMIRVPADDGTTATVLLVEEGKFGANGRTRPHDGQPVRVTGTLLRRDGWRMLELATTEDSLRPTELSEPERARLRRSPPRSLGRVSLRGEIVDSKCYLGAMKPGGGRTHRGCAILCLKGGIPPLFVSRTGGTSRSIYLLTSESRGLAYDAQLDLVGLPVVIDGVAEEHDDITVLRVLPNGVWAE
jgi:hypothetical protein